MANGYSAGSLFLGIEAEANNTLTVLDAVIERLTIINKNINGISGKTRRTKASEIGSSSRNQRKSDKSMGNFLNIGKWTAILYASKRLGSYMAKVVQYGADYTETLNLWETSMGNNLNVATEFVNKMNEAYGISEKTLMNAQAIFKNMLGSLGQISDSMAYSLSEGITQMALDYASLYNVTFEQAFTKFQAALAGQVRPIRSVAGYDITENTLFQLYQSLGGEKTMRQLSRTERQLLAIYAVFKQMDASGATGDLAKTMESFANQSRVMAEGWQRTMTYSGVLLTHLIEQSGIMTYLNAVLIFLGDTLKAVAESMGAIKSFADPFESTTEGALDASDAIDEVKGKLLDFDKFRSLSGQSENVLGLDEKLLAALSNFDSILEGSSMEAQKLAEQFKIMSGLFDEKGVFQVDKWNELKDAIEDVGNAILIAFSVNAVKSIVNFARRIDWAKTSVDLLNGVILGLAFYAFAKAIEAFSDGDYWAGAFATTIGVSLVAAFYLLNNAVIAGGKIFVTVFGRVISTFELVTAGVAVLVMGIVSLAKAWGDMSGWHRALTIIGAVTAAIIGMVVAIKALQLGIPTALGLGAALAGGVMLISSQFKTPDIPMHANGASDIDGGTLFVAGEMGKTEAVYTGSNGKANVANIQQIKTAHSQALKEWWATAKHDIPAFQGVSDSGLYTIVDGEAKRRGKRFANV